MLREKAELVNYRRRKDEEVSGIIKYSNEELIKEMLPIVDNFERAIKLDDNDLSDELSKFLSGFKMIYTSVINLFNKYEVKAIDGTSKPFDPAYHQAVLTESIDGVEPKEENVYNKKYPISRPFLLVTKGDATGDAKSFIDYVLSDEGQKTIEKEGFMSVNQK